MKAKNKDIFFTRMFFLHLSMFDITGIMSIFIELWSFIL